MAPCNNRAQYMQKGHKMCPYLPFGGVESQNKVEPLNLTFDRNSLFLLLYTCYMLYY